MYALCPYCRKPRILVYYSNIDGYQCIVCGSIIRNPKPIKQKTLTEKE